MSDRGRLLPVFGLPPGADFPRALVDGLIDRFASDRPEDLARVRLFVNTRRMHRRIAALFDDRGARLLPKIRLITEIGRDHADPALPPSAPALRRRLELAQLVTALLDRMPDLAPRSAIYDLADSLARLLDEMQGEGVGRDALAALDLSDSSEHWRRRRRFIDIVLGYLEEQGGRAPDPELRQRLAVERIARAWASAPPRDPVVVAGSTGSRGTTAMFMQLVAGLPDGCVVLPGFDFDMPARAWGELDSGLAAEDHPQFRFRAFLDRLGLPPGDVRPWTDAPPPSPDRNRLVSLALRPAPVTHQWMTEGPRLADLSAATRDMTLIEAPNLRIEALSIAMVMRRAVEEDRTVALISPDRMLTRRVAAALDRWGIVPDDSAGEPLSQSPPGRLLRHVAALFQNRLTVEDLLVLLKHPLVATGAEDRGPHLLWTRELELHLRRHGPPFPETASLVDWAARSGEADRIAWAAWVGDTLCDRGDPDPRPLSDRVGTHLRIAEALAAGPGREGSGELWAKAAGRKARDVMAELTREAGHGGSMSATDYAGLISGLTGAEEVRDPLESHPKAMIWGTLEARVQGADIVILGGLNEGIWPALPDPDPWLNRQMRKDAGLLLPERQIGLAAHDFQQAVAAPDVVLTRSLRDADAETVPSRWLNRMKNLLAGLPETGAQALEAMQARGDEWLCLAEALEPKPLTPASAPRPAPRPPVAMRPRRLSVTQIQTLIRDPYAIYARMILGLSPLNPLRQKPDAPLRGTVLHDIVEEFIETRPPADRTAARDLLLTIADRHLADGAPWPVARRLWRARLERVAGAFLAGEERRRSEGAPEVTEGWGELLLGEVDFTLTAKADRIDRLTDGRLAIYDYKSASIPTPKQIRQFDKQLLLEAIIAEAGGFTGVPAASVAKVGYIGLGGDGGIQMIDLADPDFELGSVRTRLAALVRAYDRPDQGYASRRSVEREGFAGDYDHLARHGEWDEGTPPTPEDVP